MAYLHLIIGPMFSGKSSELIRIAKRSRTIGKPVLAIKHQIDDRYTKKEIILNHDRNQLPVDNIFVLSDLNDLRKVDIDEYEKPLIIIEELQFFKNAFKNVIKFVEEWGLSVVCAGLDGDFMRQPFGDVLQLIPYSDKITKLSALCKMCGDGSEAHFSKRISKSEDTVLVGGVDEYQPVCRKHYLE